MATQVRSAVGPILLNLQASLATALALDRTAVKFWVRGKRPPHFSGGPDIVLRVRGERVDRDRLTAGGGYTEYRTRLVSVICRTRVLLDPADRDDVHLLDAQGGHLAFEDSVLAALQLDLPLDAASNALVACPVRVLDLSEPNTDSDEEWEWFHSTFDLEVDYVRPSPVNV